MSVSYLAMVRELEFYSTFVLKIANRYSYCSYIHMHRLNQGIWLYRCIYIHAISIRTYVILRIICNYVAISCRLHAISSLIHMRVRRYKNLIERPFTVIPILRTGPAILKYGPTDPGADPGFSEGGV